MLRRTLPALLFATPALAQRPAPHQDVIDKATATVAAMKADRGFRNSAALLARAKGVMVVPELSRGGLLIGGQGGTGVLLARGAQGWSFPAFYSIAGGTVGLQVGFQQAQMVFIIQSQNALDSWMQNRVRFGGQDGIAVLAADKIGNQNAIAEGRADVITWSHASGAYAGITLEGTSVSFKPEETAQYYGQSLTAQDLLQRGRGRGTGADRLRAQLG